MKPITEYNFREICEQFVKIEPPIGVGNLLNNPEYLIAFGYIDPVVGTSFQVLGVMNNNEITEIKDVITLRYSENYVLEPMKYEEMPSSMILTGSNIRLKSRESKSDNQLAFRYIEDFDPYRDNQFPDDIFIPVYKNIKLEKIYIWVTPIKIMEDGTVITISLEHDGNISEGDEICIGREEDGIIGIPKILLDNLVEEETTDENQ